jgi:hypothetical protein
VTNAADVFDIDKLQSAIANAIAEMDRENARYPNDPPDIRDWGVEIIAADWHGTHMPGIVASNLQLEEPTDCDDWEEIIVAYNEERELYLAGKVAWEPGSPWDSWQWSWEEIEEQSAAMAQQLNELCADSLWQWRRKQRLTYSLYFGQLEGGGDYMLIVAEDDTD